MVLRIAQFFRNLHREEKGFTLIELLIVIAILAVLAAIAIPLVVNRIDEARSSANDANLRMLEGAVALYKLDVGSECPSIDALVSDPASEGKTEGWNGPYIKEVPKQVTGYSEYSVNDGEVGGGESTKDTESTGT